jgi:predicted transcriptional regulator
MRQVRAYLGLRQLDLAEITGASQATVSRWDSGELEPRLEDLTRIREFALTKGFDWRDSMFFEPVAQPTEQPVSE